MTEIVTLGMQDDICLTDQQTIDNNAKIIQNFASIISTVIGFDGVWDTQSTFQQLTLIEMRDNLA